MRRRFKLFDVLVIHPGMAHPRGKQQLERKGGDRTAQKELRHCSRAYFILLYISYHAEYEMNSSLVSTCAQHLAAFGVVIHKAPPKQTISDCVKEIPLQILLPFVFAANLSTGSTTFTMHNLTDSLHHHGPCTSISSKNCNHWPSQLR